MNTAIRLVINKLNNILFEHKYSPVASTKQTNMPSNTFNAKLDSGTSKHFFKSTHSKFLNNVQELKNGLIAYLPNNTIVQASHKATITLHDNISKKASEVLIFPHLRNESLISIGQLCNDDCIIIFTKRKLFVTKNGHCLFQGMQNKHNCLWDFKQTRVAPQHKNMNYIISKNKSQSDLARYYHVTLFSPSISTLKKALNNSNLSTLPGITQLIFMH